MRCLFYILTAVGLLAAIPVAAQEPPEHLRDDVFIVDIWEHKIILAAPVSFVDTEKGYFNVLSWADWGCQQYGRRAVGPINQKSADELSCPERKLLGLTCNAHFLYICASD